MRSRAWLIVGFFALAACASSPRIAPPLPERSSAWAEITPRPAVIDGELITPACSGAPGADPAFRFWAKRGSEDGLVIFFDGGGACWDDVTCSRPFLASTPREHANETFYKAELMARDDPRTIGGLFDLDNPRNPVRNWSFVFVPYCTAGVHSGSNTAVYTDPETHQPFTINHRGADNFRVILAWMVANFATPSEILVTGSSAGAYGAVTNYGRVREAYPGGRAVMLGDAGQGVTPDGFLGYQNEKWRYSLPASVFGPNATLSDGEDVLAQLAVHFPADRFAQYTTVHDRVQVAYFAQMGAADPCNTWTEAMERDLAQRGATPNFRSYLAAGDTHTILRSPLFYTEQSGGQFFVDWLSALLRADDAAPSDRACERCTAPPPRCP